MPFKNPHPLYSVWQGMIRRCKNTKCRQWHDYGGRGINVCERWTAKGEGFYNFITDMGPRPEGYSLDRINNNLGYSPENCKWSSKKDQQRNQRVTRKVIIEGVEYIAADLSEISGLKTDTIVNRASLGLTYNEVISKDRRVFKEGLSIGQKYGRGAKKWKENQSIHFKNVSL